EQQKNAAAWDENQRERSSLTEQAEQARQEAASLRERWEQAQQLQQALEAERQERQAGAQAGTEKVDRPRGRLTELEQELARAGQGRAEEEASLRQRAETAEAEAKRLQQVLDAEREGQQNSFQTAVQETDQLRGRLAEVEQALADVHAKMAEEAG